MVVVEVSDTVESEPDANAQLLLVSSTLIFSELWYIGGQFVVDTTACSSWRSHGGVRR
jgi:hypothetical protein